MANNSVRVFGPRITAALIVMGLSGGWTTIDGQQMAATKAETAITATQRVTVHFDNMSVRAVVAAIASQAGLTPSYNIAVIPPDARVTVHANDVLVGDAFDRALKGTGLVARIQETGNVVIVRDSRATMLSGSIMGKVVDANTKRPLRGVTVTVDEDARGAQTGDDGTFQRPTVSAGTHRISARLLGYTKAVKTVTVVDGQTVTVDFALEPSVNALDQVIVTGTVVATARREVPNAMTVITAKDLEQRGITQIQQLFRGDVPGLFAQNSGTNSTVGEVVMYSRGATAFSSNSSGTSNAALNDGNFMFTNPIKTYVDGVELADARYLSQIDPKSIERIEILTGPQASTIYGSNAINGVMQIFTKRGTNTRKLTLNVMQGWIESNYNSARTPQHDYSLQLSGVEAKMSYNMGGTWSHEGAWTPEKRTIRTGMFGGARLDMPTPGGPVTIDMTLRRNSLQNRLSGFSIGVGGVEPGWYTTAISSTSGITSEQTRSLAGQTLGGTLGFAPTSWWSHELVVGQDVSDVEFRGISIGYKTPTDTLMPWRRDHTERRSLRYSTTMRMSLTSFAQGTVTAGGDGWQSAYTLTNVSASSLIGNITSVGTTNFSRRPDHNAGGFLQMQLGLQDKLFLTYGLRAEWNPGFGSEERPNYAPRYGVAYTQDLGMVTAKMRASYGRSTRPPAPVLAAGQRVTEYNPFLLGVVVPWYGDYQFVLPNPELTPEHQQGGEGGIELYFGSRASLTVTRYNQTVDALVDRVLVDSVKSLMPGNTNVYVTSTDAEGYTYYSQYQYLNIGSIRNQGWELQGSVQTGPLTTRGTYSWTKSRTIGVNSKYRSLLTSNAQYQPGATFKYLAEHTWAGGITYASARSTVALNITGIGSLRNNRDAFNYKYLINYIRLPQNHLSMSQDRRISFNPAYTMAGLTATQRFSRRAEALLQVENIADRYVNDYIGSSPVMGRQFKFGLRLQP